MHKCRNSLLFLSATCAIGIACGVRAGVSSTDFPILDASLSAGEGETRPCLTEMEGEILCGRFRVFEDRESSAGRVIDLAFVIAKAFGESTEITDAVTFFFGGPGASATFRAAQTIASGRGRGLRQQRDLLFLDFRGVGQSAALYCDVPFPSGVESRFGTIFPLDHAQACLKKLTRNADLKFYTSAHNMDDLNDLRAWLDYPSLSLIGGSYGTREAQVFLRRHGERARLAILNGVSPIFTAGYVTHARGLQAALDMFVAECEQDSQCASNHPAFREHLAETLTTVKNDPPQVVVDDVRVRFGPGEYGYALRGLLYARAADIPDLVAKAVAGNWQPLADYYLERSGWVGTDQGLAPAGMHFSVLCAEDVSRVSREVIQQETEGTFLGDYLIGGYKDVCDIWPHARLDPSFWEPVVSDVPVLMISGGRDPVTPPSGAAALAQYFSNGFSLVVKNAGHGVGGSCVDDMQIQFVESGRVSELDTSCL